MKLKISFAMLLGLVVTGCTRPNPLYCDDLRPCKDPATPFCELHICVAERATGPLGQMGGDAGVDGMGGDGGAGAEWAGAS